MGELTVLCGGGSLDNAPGNCSAEKIEDGVINDQDDPDFPSVRLQTSKACSELSCTQLLYCYGCLVLRALGFHVLNWNPMD